MNVKEADVAIDFSNPELLFPLLEEQFNLPLVIAATGDWKKRNVNTKLETLSQRTPVFLVQI